MNKNILYKNQLEAINFCKENNFESGIIHHATGTGKSITGINIIIEYNNIYNNKNIFWICEHKFILETIFTNDNIIKYLEIIKKTHNIYNFSLEKNSQWPELLNKSEKPLFVIINRTYLITREKYKNIKKNIDFIIHDECHSIENNTSQVFYNYLKENHNYKVIGLSATPNVNIYPFNNLLHTYTLYDALIDKNIVTPKIIWFNKENEITFSDIACEIKPYIDKLLYKKIIVWCGLIDICKKLYNMWNEFYPNYTICIDTSDNDNNDNNNYDIFKNIDKNAFLFCAAKHREGSDIKNLDGCLFLDKVSKRTPKTFMQCVGRVLRKAPEKQYGLIIDAKAKNAYEIVKRMSIYLNNSNEFPYDYTYSINNDTKIKTNILNILDRENNQIINEDINFNSKVINKEYIISKFKRKIPNEKKYNERIEKEFNLFIEKDLLKYLNFAIEILELTIDIPHVTRGSCGSSLLCYLVGITGVDPVKYNIKFERFLNKYRNTLPDIDFDFPHILRDDIFYKLEKEWPGKIARISNHVHFHEKSAKREALRKMGHNKFIGKYEVDYYIKNNLTNEETKIFNKLVKNMENTFSHYSLHCGGIVLYPDGVPEYLKHIQKSSNVINQITLSKYDIANIKMFKIDILSSRALTQLMEIDKELSFLDFNEITIDENVMQLFKNGNNIGITLAESPLIKKAMINVLPNNVSDLAKILSIIRPAAKDAKNDINNNEAIIYDDDAIDIISKYTGVDYELSDFYRRNFIKNNYEEIENMYNYCKNSNDRNILLEKIKNLHGYSFCKSHAYSYAELIYKLAYCKYYYPEKFWISTIKNTETSYKKWVYYYEAKIENVDFKAILKNNGSVYRENRIESIYTLSHDEHYKKYGIWNIKNKEFYPDVMVLLKNDNYYFRGIIGQTKVLDGIIIYFLGIGYKKYIEIVINSKNFNKYNYQKYIIQGFGKLKNENYISIDVKKYKFL